MAAATWRPSTLITFRYLVGGVVGTRERSMCNQATGKCDTHKTAWVVTWIDPAKLHASGKNPDRPNSIGGEAGARLYSIKI